MDFSKFLEFPGILILVGAVLLIVVLIIGLVAGKKSKSKEKKEEIQQNEPINVPNNNLVDNSIDPQQGVNSEQPVMPNQLVAEETVATPQPDPLAEMVNIGEPQVKQEDVTLVKPTTSIYGGVSPMEGINIGAIDHEAKPYEEKSFVVSETPSIPIEEPAPVEMPSIEEAVASVVEPEKEEEIETL